MSKYQRRKLWCVWDNLDDTIIAIDQPANVCAYLMGVSQSTFFSEKSRRLTKPDIPRRWTIMSSREIREDEEDE